ncbi:MAG: hypothetical protein IJD07_03200 [Clostridia bacterium]|nr:hypothetical protein [Clostridia bacterium]
MHNASENQINANVNIIALAVKTLFYFTLLASLCIACIFMANPYFAMKTSYKLGFEKNAYAYAEDYLDRVDGANISYDSKYVNALIYSIELGEKFLNKQTAKRLRDDAKLYCSVKDIDKRNQMLDDYYRNTPPSMQVAVYSYENYVSTLYARACALLGEQSFMLYGATSTFGEIVGEVNGLDFSVKADLFKFALILNQATEYEKAAKSANVVIDAIAVRVEQFVTASTEYVYDDLFRLFLVRSAVTLSEQKRSEGGVWAQSVQGYSLSDYYYKVLLYNYVQK